MAQMKTLTVNGKTYTVTDPTAANAIRGTATGNPVCITDCSPVEHELAVTLTSKTVTDFSAVTVTKRGFNWFNQEERFSQLGYAKQADGSWLGNTYHGQLAIPPVQAQGPVYIQATARAAGDIAVPLVLRAYYTDGTSQVIFQLSKDVTEFTSVKGMTNPEKTLSYMQISYGGNTAEQDAFYIRDVMFSYADGEYVPFTDETRTFAANADGRVEGILGNGEPMTLVTDTQGVTISAQYNKDTNKVVERLMQAIVSLGGSV